MVSRGCRMDDPQSIICLECMGSLHVRRQEYRAINNGTMSLAVRPPFLASPARGMAGRTAGGSCPFLRIPSSSSSLPRLSLARTLRFAPRNFHGDAALSCNWLQARLSFPCGCYEASRTSMGLVHLGCGLRCRSWNGLSPCFSCHLRAATRYQARVRCVGSFQTCWTTCLVARDVRRTSRRHRSIRMARRGRGDRFRCIPGSSVGFLCGIRLSTARISDRSAMLIGRSRCFFLRVSRCCGPHVVLSFLLSSRIF